LHPDFSGLIPSRMEALPAVPPGRLQQIRELQTTLLQRLGPPTAHPVQCPPDLEQRRVELLTHHLGFTPQPPCPRLHVIGDSHAAFFSGTESLDFFPGRKVFTGFLRRRSISVFVELLPVFRVFHTGASTAWSADAPRSASYTRRKIAALLRHDIPAGGAILLVFGEIDCRWHLPRAVLAGQTIPAATQATIRRFLPLPRRLAQAGYDVTVWQPSGVTLGAPTPAGTNHPLPIVGPQSLRLEITRIYCEQLQRACDRENLRCAGIAGKYHAWTAPAAADCFLDGCHLSQRMMPLALRALMASGALPLRPRDAAGTPLAR